MDEIAPKTDQGEVWVYSQVLECDWCREEQCGVVDCPKLHRLEYCLQYMNSFNCSKGYKCNYVHLTRAEKIIYLRRSPFILAEINREVIRSRQFGGICKAFKFSICNNRRCHLLHIKNEDILNPECQLCHRSVYNMAALDVCRHAICARCALDARRPDIHPFPNVIRVFCPICNTRNTTFDEMEGHIWKRKVPKEEIPIPNQ